MAENREANLAESRFFVPAAQHGSHEQSALQRRGQRCCVQPQAPPRAARPATDSPPLSCIDWKPFPSSICSLFKRSSSLNSDHHVSKLIYLQQTQTFKMAGKALLNSHPKACLGSKGARKCRVCANPSAIIRKYHIDMCRQCFRERARDIGFTKVCYLLTI